MEKHEKSGTAIFIAACHGKGKKQLFVFRFTQRNRGAGQLSCYSDSATGWICDKSCLDSGQEQSTFLLSKVSKHALGPTPPYIARVPDAVYPEVKWPKRKTGHSLPPSAKPKNDWIYTSALPGTESTRCPAFALIFQIIITRCELHTHTHAQNKGSMST